MHGLKSKQLIIYIYIKIAVAIGLFIIIRFILHQFQLYVLVKATMPALKKFTDDFDFDLLLDPQELKNTLERGDPEAKIKPIFINDGPEFSPLSPYDYIYGKYDASVNQDLYHKDEKGEIFSRTTRMKLVYYMIQARAEVGGAHLKLTRLKKKKVLLGAFPMHNREHMENLETRWLQWNQMPWDQPYEDIKEYFGIKIALFFCFLGHYTSSLFLPALVGFAFQLVVWVTGNFSRKLFLSILCHFL